VASPDPDLGESIPAVELLRPDVVRTHLEEQLSAAAPGRLGHQPLEQRGADSVAPVADRNSERDHVTLVTGAEQAAVADDPVGYGGYQVVPGSLLKLTEQHLRAPRLVAEHSLLKLDHLRKIRRCHRAEHDTQHDVSA